MKQLDWAEIYYLHPAQEKKSKRCLSVYCKKWYNIYGKSYISLYKDEMLRTNKPKTQDTNME